MFPIQDQISVVTRNSLEAQLAMFTSLSNKTLESFEKLVNLNITAAKATLDESTSKAQEMFAAQNPQEFFALSAAQAQPSVEKAMAYGRHLTSIASGTQAEYVKVAEHQLAEANRKFGKMVDDASKQAPEGVAELVKTAIDNATKGFEQMSRTSKQAAQAVEANVAASMNQMTKTA
jgi:phasin family protein